MRYYSNLPISAIIFKFVEMSLKYKIVTIFTHLFYFLPTSNNLGRTPARTGASRPALYSRVQSSLQIRRQPHQKPENRPLRRTETAGGPGRSTRPQA